MKFIRNIHHIKPEHRGCAVTIGNFDGVHLGHQRIIQQLKQLGLPSLVICFEPQPGEYFHPDNAPTRLTRLREKLIYLSQYGIDYVLCLPFNKMFADIAPEDFIQNLLIQQLAIKHLVIGQDFQFGHQRTGNIQLLQQSLDVTIAEDVLYDDMRISSSRVRTALAQGDLKLAQALLGRPYSMQGRVIKGTQLGRQLGFPTANIQLGRKRPALTGVFAVYANGHPGVANLGTRPTVDGSRTLLEVHLFDVDQNLYHQHLQVDFIHKLRDERRFKSIDQLKTQIAQDAAQALTALSYY